MPFKDDDAKKAYWDAYWLRNGEAVLQQQRQRRRLRTERQLDMIREKARVEQLARFDFRKN